jgi:hypothetical protein
MSIYYPQAAISLRVIWEDFGSNSEVLQQVSVMQLSARSVTVDINDYTEADTFKARIDYKSFPFDPRCIRSLGIAVYMEDKKGLFKRNNSLNLIEPSDDNIIFQGFADEGGIDFNDDTRTVMIEGRDFTSLFIDQKRLNTSPIPLSKPIDQIMEDLIKELKSTEEIIVVNRSGEDLPTLSKLAPDFNPTTSVKNQKRKETYWDIMQSILRRVGLIGFIEIDKFVITKPRNIYEKKEIKQFIYGGNIKDLSFRRKLGRAKNYNVRLTSANLLKKTVITADIPKEAKSEDFISEFGNTEVTIAQLDKDGKKIDPPKVADYITFPVPNINDKETLITMAEDVYEELSRQQIEGSLSTFEMEIPEEVDNEFQTGTFPVLFSKIRNGTAIRIYLSQDELGEIKSDSTYAQKRNFLVRRGYPIEIANAFAESLNRINTAFYVKNVKFELDQEDGFRMNIDFINFIDIDSSSLGKI